MGSELGSKGFSVWLQCYARPVHEDRGGLSVCVCCQQHQVLWRHKSIQGTGGSLILKCGFGILIYKEWTTVIYEENGI